MPPIGRKMWIFDSLNVYTIELIKKWPETYFHLKCREKRRKEYYLGVSPEDPWVAPIHPRLIPKTCVCIVSNSGRRYSAGERKWGSGVSAAPSMSRAPRVKAAPLFAQIEEFNMMTKPAGDGDLS